MEDCVIQTNSIHKIYKTGGLDTHALKGVSLKINKGEFVIITGRNGSGKLTLMHQLALLDKPDKGQVIINNQDTSRMGEVQKTKLRLLNLGYIFQEYALIAELTALENVILPAMMHESGRLAKKRAIGLLKKVGLAGKYNRLPPQLSGGEQQKVAIARSLINSPSIIFADEPTANLDTVASKDIMEIFKTLNQRDNITIVMVTHEPEELAYATRHITVSDGRLK